jgi:hypothetical protein
VRYAGGRVERARAVPPGPSDPEEPVTRPHTTRLLLAALLLTAAACDDTTTSLPTVTPSPTVTETFSGNLTVNGGITHPFTTQSLGTITTVITSLSPATATVGLSLGTWNGTSCNIVQARDQAGLGATVVLSVSGSGSVCVRVYDPGVLTGPVAYVVDVSHP